MTFPGDQSATTGPEMREPYEAAGSINWIDLDSDLWDGAWQDGPEHRSLTGTEQEVQEWAASQPAVRYWINNGFEFVPRELGTASSSGWPSRATSKRETFTLVMWDAQARPSGGGLVQLELPQAGPVRRLPAFLEGRQHQEPRPELRGAVRRRRAAGLRHPRRRHLVLPRPR